jgi:hypothetical protein
MTKTVTKEKGKTDKIADGAGSVTVAPEGEGAHQIDGTRTEYKDRSSGNLHENARDGWINGQPATREEIEKSMA